MKTLTAPFQAHLDQGATTLCQCWRLSLRSGEKMGFTDHDENLIFDGTSFEAQAGFSASEIQSSLGLNVDNLEAQGALQSAKLDQQRLTAGDYDHAEIEIWLVNWQDPAQRMLQRKGHLGEVSYGQGHFNAEVRGLAHMMAQPKGRLYQFACDATVGDARCAVNLTTSTYQGTGSVSFVDSNAIKLTGLQSFADDWFTRGTVRFGTRTLEVKRHRKFSSFVTISFWKEPSFVIQVGDVAVLQAGCDKRYETCRLKFANGLNFRGFPTMPGNDFVLAVVNSSSSNNGSKRT